MATITSLLSDHVTFELRSIDRIFLQACSNGPANHGPGHRTRTRTRTALASIARVSTHAPIRLIGDFHANALDRLVGAPATGRDPSQLAAISSHPGTAELTLSQRYIGRRLRATRRSEDPGLGTTWSCQRSGPLQFARTTENLRSLWI